MEIAELLISIDCLQVSPSKPFTYASGLKGPIYCDNRKILSHIEKREDIAHCLKDLVINKSLQYDLIAGLATAGIPHGMLLADRIKKPFIYIRGKAKAHGKNNQVEGAYKESDVILMVEDLVNQGKSLKEAVIGAREAGLIVKDVLCIVDYEMQNAKEVLKELGLSLYSLTNFSSICDASKKAGRINDEEFKLLHAWQMDPANWINS